MEFEWDSVKAQRNSQKHGVRFADAVSILDDDRSLTVSEQGPDGEVRLVTLGSDLLGRILVVVYTWRGERVRIISARKATPRERRQYSEVG